VAVWEGVVHTFDLSDHTSAKRCYAWSSLVEGTNKRKFYAVLHQAPVTLSQDAVRAAIVSDYKNEE